MKKILLTAVYVIAYPLALIFGLVIDYPLWRTYRANEFEVWSYWRFVWIRNFGTVEQNHYRRTFLYQARQLTYEIKLSWMKFQIHASRSSKEFMLGQLRCALIEYIADGGDVQSEEFKKVYLDLYDAICNA